MKLGSQYGCGEQLNCRMFITLFSYLRMAAAISRKISARLRATKARINRTSWYLCCCTHPGSWARRRWWWARGSQSLAISDTFGTCKFDFREYLGSEFPQSQSCGLNARSSWQNNGFELRFDQQMCAGYVFIQTSKLPWVVMCSVATLSDHRASWTPSISRR